MHGALRSVLVCSPASAGWFHPERAQEWSQLGYRHAVDAEAAAAQHRTLVTILEEQGVEVWLLPADPGLTLDAVYTHDASLSTDRGAVCMHMGKVRRREEPLVHAAFFAAQGIDVLGTLADDGTGEAGDMVWLDSRTLLVGRGLRTDSRGVEQLRAILGPSGVEVLTAPLPYGAGPGACLHLMSLLSVLDARTLLVDRSWLCVETLELLAGRGFRFVDIDPGERDTMACNVLALRRGRLVALEENRRTNARLEAAGYEVLRFAGSELCQNGGGGPTCLTRPLARDPA